jgi:hypothetical protein
MGKYAHCRQSILDGGTMGTNIYAVCQSADNKCVGTLGGKVTHKALTEVAPIVGTFACTYNADYTARVKGGVPTIEE